jgi:uncharacterized protein (DUF2236 family)
MDGCDRLRKGQLPGLPLPLRQLIGNRIKQLTGSTSQPDVFAQPAGAPALLPPDSVAWQVHAHFVGMLVGGLSSLMLQALHPRALAAVWDHSNFRHNLKGRLGRTAYFVAVTTYGPRDDALAAIERVNRIHAQVRGHMPDGSAYVANEPELLRWVHLGEVSSFLNGYQMLSCNPLSSTEADTYVSEMAEIGLRLGATELPMSRSECDTLLNAFRPQLECNQRTLDILEVIENYPVDPWDQPFMSLVMQAAFHALPTWALHMLGKKEASFVEKRFVTHALQLAGWPVQAVLDQDGVAAHARKRVVASTLSNARH